MRRFWITDETPTHSRSPEHDGRVLWLIQMVKDLNYQCKEGWKREIMRLPTVEEVRAMEIPGKKWENTPQRHRHQNHSNQRLS